MRLLCTECGKSVSTEVPDATIVRAALKCPECIEAQDIPRERHLAEAHAAIRAYKQEHDRSIASFSNLPCACTVCTEYGDVVRRARGEG